MPQQQQQQRAHAGRGGGTRQRGRTGSTSVASIKAEMGAQANRENQDPRVPTKEEQQPIRAVPAAGGEAGERREQTYSHQRSAARWRTGPMAKTGAEMSQLMGMPQQQQQQRAHAGRGGGTRQRGRAGST